MFPRDKRHIFLKRGLYLGFNGVFSTLACVCVGGDEVGGGRRDTASAGDDDFHLCSLAPERKSARERDCVCAQMWVTMTLYCSMVQCVAAWCSVLQHGAVCCSMVQCVAAWCSAV